MEVRRSARRRRTVSAHVEDGTVVVLVPATLSPAEERRHVKQLVARLTASQAARTLPRGTDVALTRRAQELSDAYLGGHATPLSVRWTDNQNRRWGSCTPATGTIRLSSRLKQMPGHVIDYVLLHELAHLIESAHDDRFWALVDRFPRSERARGFLEGVEAAQSWITSTTA